MAIIRGKKHQIDGMTLDSTGELVAYKAFKKRFKKSLTREPYCIEYILNYYPDFSFINKHGEEVIIECKSTWLKPEDKRKMLAVKREHPDEDIRFVFSSKPPPKLVRFCKRHKYLYAAEFIPQEWMDKSRKELENEIQ